MGHYYVDMMCDTCGKIQCTCPQKPDMTHLKWIVDEDLMVIQIQDFDKKHAVIQTKYGPIPGTPILLRYKRKSFDEKKDAKAYSETLKRELRDKLKADIKFAKIQIKKLNKELGE